MELSYQEVLKMNFEYFVEKGEVKIQKTDKNLAIALKKESLERINFVYRLISNSENPKYIVENVYDLLRELVEAKLAIDGYKSYSHEATILYLKKFKEFTDYEISFLDELRKIRNRIKYYGKNIEEDKASKVIEFMELMLPKLKALLKDEK